MNIYKATWAGSSIKPEPQHTKLEIKKKLHLVMQSILSNNLENDNSIDNFIVLSKKLTTLGQQYKNAI